MKPIRCFVFFILLLAPFFLKAQFESLSEPQSRLLLSYQFDTMRVDTLNNWSFLENNTVTAQQYAQIALDYAQKIGYQAGMSDSQMNLGCVAKDDQAESYFKLALRERLASKNYPKAANCYCQIGNLKRRQGQFEAAIEQYNKGLELMQGQPLHINIVQLHNGLGDALRRSGHYGQADSVFKRAITLCEQLLTAEKSAEKHTEYLGTMVSVCMNRAAFLQDNLHQYTEAKTLLLQCLSDFKTLRKHTNVGKTLLLLGNNAYFTQDFEEAKQYFDQGISLKDSIRPNDYFVLIKNRARVLLDQGQFKAAKNDLNTCLKGFYALPDTPMIAASLFEFGSFFYEQSALDSAVFYYQQALSLPISDVLSKGRLLYFLADAQYQLGQKEAADSTTNQYITLMQSLNAEQTKGVFNELMQHQLGKNRLLRKYERLAKQRMAYRAGIAIGGATVLLILAMLFARIQRQKRRLAERNTEIAVQQQELAEQNEEIARQNEQIAINEKLDLLKNKELETNYARLAGQDEMQKKIGQELHDGVGAMLATIKLNLSPVDGLIEALPEDKRKLYHTANRLLDEASEDVRRISHELSSAILQKFGLKAQLEALAEVIPGSNKLLQVELVTHGLKERLAYKTELQIYRMVQELVHNVIKHAHALNITIQVSRFEHVINVIVEDDGQGFDVDQVSQNPGMGIHNLAARVHELSGVLQIDARPGRGTIVSIDIPVKS